VALTSYDARTGILALLSGATAAGTSVYDSRKVNVDDDDIPIVCVYTTGSEDLTFSRSSPLYKHVETISIVGFVTGSSDAVVASNLDAMATAIKTTLATNQDWFGQFGHVDGFTETREYDVSNNRRISAVSVSVRLNWHENYAATAPDVSFDEVAVTVECTEPDGAGTTERVIEV
jgi:hypothetical protein